MERREFAWKNVLAAKDEIGKKNEMNFIKKKREELKILYIKVKGTFGRKVNQV